MLSFLLFWLSFGNLFPVKWPFQRGLNEQAWKGIKEMIPAPVRAFLRRLIPSDGSGHDWIPASSVEKQAMTFRFRGRSLCVEADYSSLLYEIVAELVDFDAYQLNALDWSSAANATIIDIGGNIGVFSLMAASLTKGKVFCVEPSPANCQLIMRNAALNQADGIELVSAAVAGTSGEMWFQLHRTSVGGSLQAGVPADTQTAIRIKTLTLDQLLQKAPDGRAFLVKMDIEGGEYDILAKLRPETAARIQYLTFEVHDQDREHNVNVIRARLDQLGYRVRHKPDLYGRTNLHHLLAGRTLRVPE